MIIKESNCVSCERCIHCGRENGYVIYRCDFCRNTMEENNEFCYFENKIICPNCLIDKLYKDSEIKEIEEGFEYNGEIFEYEEDLIEALKEEYETVEWEDEDAYIC